jgi:hypothetical protein
VISVTISIYKGCSGPLCLQLFVGEFMSYGRYLCLFANRGVQYILRCVFVFYKLIVTESLLMSVKSMRVLKGLL